MPAVHPESVELLLSENLRPSGLSKQGCNVTASLDESMLDAHPPADT